MALFLISLFAPLLSAAIGGVFAREGENPARRGLLGANNRERGGIFYASGRNFRRRRDNVFLKRLR